MSSLISQLSSLLLVSNRPLSVRKLAELTNEKLQTVQAVLEELAKFYEKQELGIKVFQTGSEFQMVTDPLNSELIGTFVKQETSGELTKPQLETLAIIAYRGSISKSEIELIRGINCSLILRNLLMRGLIREQESNRQIAYSVSMDFLKFLGLARAQNLPEYQTYANHELIAELVSGTGASKHEVNSPSEQNRIDPVGSPVSL